MNLEEVARRMVEHAESALEAMRLPELRERCDNLDPHPPHVGYLGPLERKTLCPGRRWPAQAWVSFTSTFELDEYQAEMVTAIIQLLAVEADREGVEVDWKNAIVRPNHDNILDVDRPLVRISAPFTKKEGP